MAKKKTVVVSAPEMEQPQESYQLIDIDQLMPDHNQPRKHFGETEMAELQESIKINGIIQPVMVNDTSKTFLAGPLKGKKQFTIVCGERRCRAANAVGLKSIPCVIRHLSPDQVLEIQIVENLQRKEVNPMEEANAFRVLVDHNFSIEEIAAKVGKGPAFVAQRLKLTNLIEGFQDLLYADKMTLVVAGKVCRFDPSTQKELLKEAVPKDWKTKKAYMLDNIRRLDEKGEDLDYAKFKTEDPDLYPEAGACNKCPHNSAANKLIFPDLKNSRICHNPGCFAIKTGRAYTQSIEAALQIKHMLFVSFSSYLDKEEKAKIKAIEDMGIVITGRDKLDLLSAPEAPLGLEAFLEEKKQEEWLEDENENEIDFDQLSKKEQQTLITKWTAEWQEEKDDYDKDLASYNEKISSGAFLKAFVVTSDWRNKSGSIVDVTFKAGKKMEVADDAPEEMKAVAKQSEIAAIKDREKRNEELDREKVYNRSMEQLKDMYVGMNDELHWEEWRALMVLLADICYEAREALGDDDYNRINLFKKLKKEKHPAEESFTKFIRIALFDKLVNKNSADPERYGAAGAMMDIARVFIPDHVKLFEAEQKDKSDKRQANISKRLETLKN